MDGRAVLFTGAGFSFGARNHNEKKLPAGSALATELLTEISYGNRTGSLDKASAAFLRRKSDTELVELISDRFTLGRVTESHREIAKLPWKRAYTTNYDLVFEEARKNEAILCNSVDGIDDPKDHISKSNLMVHINGAINRLSVSRLGSSFKLVSESYASDSFEDSGWAFHFRNDIRTAAAVIFVGYSMYDLDVRRILFNEDISDKCIFIVAPLSSENELDAEDLSDLGLVAPIGLDAFADMVADARASYVPIESALLLESWSEVDTSISTLRHPTDEEVIDFFIEGKVSNSIAMETIGPNKTKYLIDHRVNSAIKQVVQNEMLPALLIGDLGTGKSFILDELSLFCATLGWRIFKLNISSAQEIEELEEISKQPGNKLLLVENYQSHLELLKWYSETQPKNTSLVLTARTTIHDLFSDDLEKIFSSGIKEYDISTLHPAEVRNVIKIFDEYGLWGERLGWPESKKNSFIKNDCNNSLPSILLDILNSRHIADRYKKLLSGISNRTDVESVLICAFSLEVMGFAPRIHHIQELMENKVNWSKLRAQAEIRSIIDLNQNFLRAKSSVLGMHLLRSAFSSKQILITLIRMAHSASDLKRDVEFKNILNALMRYKNISSIFPEENKLPSVINFYENIKNLPSTKKNPQFWLQYAIACLALGQIDRSERYFKDAYDLVYPGYNTFKLDNAYARLLLEKSMRESSMYHIMLLVDKAKDIILSQMKTEKRYYPYRVALGFFKIYERFSKEWKPNQLTYFKFIFSEIHRNASFAISSGHMHHYIQECLDKSSSFSMPLKP